MTASYSLITLLSNTLYIQYMAAQSNEETRELSTSKFVIVLLGAVSIFGFFVMFGAGTRFDEGMFHVSVCVCYVWLCV